jgi:hypothetical protein
MSLAAYKGGDIGEDECCQRNDRPQAATGPVTERTGPDCLPELVLGLGARRDRAPAVGVGEPQPPNWTTAARWNWTLSEVRSARTVADMTVITHTEQPGLARYRDALRTPGVLGFAIPGVVGRMPMAMLSLALVMLLAAVTGSYGIAGAVSAAGALAYAGASCWAARACWMRRSRWRASRTS